MTLGDATIVGGHSSGATVAAARKDANIISLERRTDVSAANDRYSHWG